MICATINAGVLSIYSYIAPLITDRAGLPGEVIPFALMAFGIGALVGNILGGRLGDTHPYAASFGTAAMTVLTVAGIWLFSAQPVPLLIFFTLLGLFGLSANPILVALAVRFGAGSPTLAAAMPTSIFNLGTAVGTAITSMALESSLGSLAPAIVGTVFALLTFIPLTALLAVVSTGDPFAGPTGGHRGAEIREAAAQSRTWRLAELLSSSVRFRATLSTAPSAPRGVVLHCRCAVSGCRSHRSDPTSSR